MEEQIIKILENCKTGVDDGYGGLNEGVMDDNFQYTAQEITSHVMEFIDWLREWTEPRVNGWAILNDDLGGYTIKPIGEAYQHWLTNVCNNGK